MWNFFEKRVEAFPKEDKEFPPTKFWGFIRYYSKGFWKYLIIISILSACIAAGEALFFYFIGLFVDEFNASSSQDYWEKSGSTVILFLFLTLFFLPLVLCLHHLFLNQVVRPNFSMQIKFRMHRHLLKQSLNFFNNDFAGRLSQKIFQTSAGVQEVVLKSTNVVVHILVYFCTMLGMLWQADVFLMLVLLCWSVIYVSIMCVFIPKLRRQSSINAETRSVMMGSVVDSYTNIQTVKLFSKNQDEVKHAKKVMQNCLNADYQMMRLVTSFDLCVQMLNYVLIAALVVLSIYLWQNHIILVGSIAVSLGLAIRINNLSQWVMWEVGMLFEYIGNVQNGLATLSKNITVRDPENPIKDKKIFGDIEFRDVTFSYNNKTNIFENFNLHIKPGERVGIVGHSGSGKSTLLNLLLRFYDVNSGGIYLDGEDIRHFNQDDLRSELAVCSQDTSLLHRSIRDNILYGSTLYEVADHNLVDSELRDVANKVCALDFIEELTDARGNNGFDVQVGERGVRLSGGQRQRIALARVILKNSPIFILDEATAALDSEIENIINNNLEALMQNKTVIAIAHRLSTIAKMDRLVVLEHGHIAEMGTHAELLALNGVYAKLWKHQTNGFLG